MNYIYDIVLNYNDLLYEFFDWNENDLFTKIRKIPVFKVNNKTMCDLKYYDVILDDSFIYKIKNKTEYYLNGLVKLTTSFLITDGLDIIAIKIDKRLKYSSLQIEDELDILENLKIKESLIKYEKKDKINNHFLKTRNQILEEKNIEKLINKITSEHNISKLKYIYYECFNEKENNVNKIIRRFKSLKNDKKILSKLSKIIIH